MKLEVLSLDAEKVGTIELDDAIFGLAPRADLIQRVVKWQLAKRRAGTHKVQRRGDVSVTHKKLYKQKGTGGARHGSRNAPIFRGGGVAHGPENRSHETDLNKKVKALGLRHALSAKIAAQRVIVLDDAKLGVAKTKELVLRLKRLGVENGLLIGGAAIDGNFGLAARNIPNFDVLPVGGANVYDILRRKTLLLTRDAVEGLGKRLNPVEGASA